MNKLPAIILLCAVIASQSGRAEQIQLTLEHGSVQRTYHLYVPSTYRESKPTPLLMALHGRPGNPQRMVDLTGFNARAEQHGFIVVYPQGLDRYWNYLHGISGYRPQPNDSDFLLSVVDDIRNHFSIDDRRIYATGISNGGFMAQRLACHAPDKFAGFASVAATGYAGMSLDCVEHSPVNMLYLHGTADTKVPWKGLSIEDGSGGSQAVTLSITDSVKFWSDRNRCSAQVSSQEIQAQGNSPGTRVKILSSNACANHAEVVLYAVIGGGHNWPGVPDFIPPAVAGRVNLDIHASDVIWTFFSSKQLNR